jgi:hypothetical protein
MVRKAKIANTIEITYSEYYSFYDAVGQAIEQINNAIKCKINDAIKRKITSITESDLIYYLAFMIYICNQYIVNAKVKMEYLLNSQQKKSETIKAYVSNSQSMFNGLMDVHKLLLYKFKQRL